jgi:small redox-active disulfide protein 2
MDVKVLGTGCARCHTLYDEVDRALKDLGLEATLTRVERIDEILRFGVMATPALVIDGQVKAAGRIPTTAELTGWLTTVAVR